MMTSFVEIKSSSSVKISGLRRLYSRQGPSSKCSFSCGSGLNCCGWNCCRWNCCGLNCCEFSCCGLHRFWS